MVPVFIMVNTHALLVILYKQALKLAKYIVYLRIGVNVHALTVLEVVLP